MSLPIEAGALFLAVRRLFAGEPRPPSETRSSRREKPAAMIFLSVWGTDESAADNPTVSFQSPPRLGGGSGFLVPRMYRLLEAGALFLAIRPRQASERRPQEGETMATLPACSGAVSRAAPVGALARSFRGDGEGEG